jgi:hypothetical protein
MEKGDGGKTRQEADNYSEDDEPPVMFAREAGKYAEHIDFPFE